MRHKLSFIQTGDYTSKSLFNPNYLLYSSRLTVLPPGIAYGERWWSVGEPELRNRSGGQTRHPENEEHELKETVPHFTESLGESRRIHVELQTPSIVGGLCWKFVTNLPLSK